MKTRTLRTIGAGALLAATLGLVADQAAASYTARVQNGMLEIIGNGAADTLVLTSTSGPLAVDVGGDGTVEYTFDRDTFTAIEVSAGGGADVVRVVGSLLGETVTIDGGAGDDTLTGAVGDETLIGGSGDDVVRGGDGDDVLLLGTGADTATWMPGDDDDTVEGGGGDDALDFFGSNIGEIVDVSANGSRVRFTRNVANVVMDLDDVERVTYRAFGGADTLTVAPTAGTDLEVAEADLEAGAGGGDGEVDTVVAAATEGPDAIGVTDSGAIAGLGAETRIAAGAETHDDLVVRALGGDDEIAAGVGLSGPATVNVDGGLGVDTTTVEGTGDADAIPLVANGGEVRVGAALDTLTERLVVHGHGGADTMSAVGNVAALVQITMDGGSGADVIGGGNGADVLIGGSGDDRVDGNQGLDTAQLGSGDDRFNWDPGDGSDTVEGQGGRDAVRVNGNGASEIYDVAANGERVRFFRNIANVTLDLGGVEGLDLASAGGADSIVLNDTRGTELATVDVDLAAIGGGGDAQPDAVTVNGTDEADTVRVSRSDDDRVVASGLGAAARIGGAELGSDSLRVSTLGGDDRVFVGDVFDLITPLIDLGPGE